MAPGDCAIRPTTQHYDLLTTASGSGGPSGCATGAPDIPGVVSGTCAGYPKPSWQSGFIGNPSDGVRDIPDVSLFAANGIWGHYYVVCFSDPLTLRTARLLHRHSRHVGRVWRNVGCLAHHGGDSVARQSGFREPVGLIRIPPITRWRRRSMAAGGSTSCNSALGNTVASNCIFYDVTQIPLLYTGSGTGGDIDVPCLGMNCYLPSGTYGVLSTAPQTLSSAQVTNLGSGYTSAPSCTLSGGGGSGATCSAIETGVVSSINLTNGGSGYSTATCTLTGGGGTGASCVASAGATTAVSGVVLTNFGSGYTSAPTCTISGDGTGATCTVTEATGIAVSLTAAGSGYTTLPHCVLSGGGGTGGTCAALAVNTSNAYQPAFGNTIGWDFATGIGTVNASNLVANFAPGAATLAPLSLAFPPQALNASSAAQSVTLTDTGLGALTFNSFTITGGNSSDFSVTETCPDSLASGAHCTLKPTFKPTAPGPRKSLLSVSDNAGNSPQTVILTGVGTAASLSAASLSFASQTVGTSSAAQMITLKNLGIATMHLWQIAIGGTNSGDFSKTTTCGATLAASVSCTVSVTFKPTATGARSASVLFSNDGGGSPQAVSLTGTGM